LERVLDRLQQITLPTSSLGGLSLSPTGNYLAIWEGPLDYKLYIYNLAGQQVATFEPEEITTLGIRTVAWHPNGLFLAVGGWDDRVLTFLTTTLYMLTSRSLGSPPNLLLVDTDSNHPTYLPPSVWRISLA
jgi:WD40 repeat protein